MSARVRLTDDAVLELRKRYASGHDDISVLAKEFSVSHRTARNAIRGDTFAHLPCAVPTDSGRLSPATVKSIEAELRQPPYRGQVKQTMEKYRISYEVLARIRSNLEKE